MSYTIIDSVYGPLRHVASSLVENERVVLTVMTCQITFYKQPFYVRIINEPLCVEPFFKYVLLTVGGYFLHYFAFHDRFIRPE